MCYRKLGFVICTILALVRLVKAQKTVTQQFQVWVSANTSFKTGKQWAALADLHIRRNNGLKDPSFYFLRGGMQYTIRPGFSVAGGYAHMWQAPAKPEWSTFAQEYRPWQQLIETQQIMGVSFLFRLRNEQRFTQLMAADSFTGNYRFVNRVRVLTNFLLPVFDSERKTQLLLANEFLFNLGKDAANNTFDQNRTTVGFRRKINAQWSYDFGYMMVYQKTFAVNTYNLNHTLRLFFYGNFSKEAQASAGEE